MAETEQGEPTRRKREKVVHVQLRLSESLHSNLRQLSFDTRRSQNEILTSSPWRLTECQILPTSATACPVVTDRSIQRIGTTAHVSAAAKLTRRAMKKRCVSDSCERPTQQNDSSRHGMMH